MGIRVIRVLEYHFEDVDTYVEFQLQRTTKSTPYWYSGKEMMREVGMTMSMADSPWTPVETSDGTD
jgi:hypothetical protein